MTEDDVTAALQAPAETPHVDVHPAPSAEASSAQANPTEPTPNVERELAPSIHDHAARLGLKPWQVTAIVARLHGLHDDDGERLFPEGVSLSTRIVAADFDQLADIALNGRV